MVLIDWQKAVDSELGNQIGRIDKKESPNDPQTVHQHLVSKKNAFEPLQVLGADGGLGRILALLRRYPIADTCIGE